jgi:hypothetical protein
MHDYLIVLVPSFIAIIVMVALIKAVRLERLVRFEDETPVREALNEHFEGQTAERIILDKNGHFALALMQDGAVILVRAFGDRMAVRPLNAKSIATLNGHGETLDLKLNDFTWPRAHLVFDSAAARQSAQDLITALSHTPKEAASHA